MSRGQHICYGGITKPPAGAVTPALKFTSTVDGNLSSSVSVLERLLNTFNVGCTRGCCWFTYAPARGENTFKAGGGIRCSTAWSRRSHIVLNVYEPLVHCHELPRLCCSTGLTSQQVGYHEWCEGEVIIKNAATLLRSKYKTQVTQNLNYQYHPLDGMYRSVAQATSVSVSTRVPHPPPRKKLRLVHNKTDQPSRVAWT